MANGKGHDKFNLFLGAAYTGILIGLQQPSLVWVSFLVGYLFATFIFGPDTDLMPKKRTGLLQFVLYPYSIMMKHRGWSHHPLWGTLGRILYGFIVLGISIFVLNRMGYIQFSSGNYIQGIIIFLKGYNYKLDSYLILTWIFIGMFLADLSHLFLDKVSSFFKRLF